MIELIKSNGHGLYKCIFCQTQISICGCLNPNLCLDPHSLYPAQCQNCENKTTEEMEKAKEDWAAESLNLRLIRELL